MGCCEGKPDLEYTHTRRCGCGHEVAAGTECAGCHADGIVGSTMADMRLLRAALRALVAVQTMKQRQPLPLTFKGLCPGCGGDVVVRRIWNVSVEVECGGCHRLVRT